MNPVDCNRDAADLPALSTLNSPLLSASPRSRTPSCGSEDRRASVTLARPSAQCPDLDSNQGLDLRRVQCNPLHHRDRADDWIRTSIVPLTRRMPFCVEPRRQAARVQGVEPCRSVLEADGSPGSTLVNQGVRGELNPHFRLHKPTCRNHYTTGTIQGCQLSAISLQQDTEADEWFTACC